MSEDVAGLKKEIERLKGELEHYRKMVSGYENVLKLNEMELDNAQKIISMYENIVEYSRVELKLATETARHRKAASQLGRSERRAPSTRQRVENRTASARAATGRLKSERYSRGLETAG